MRERLRRILINMWCKGSEGHKPEYDKSISQIQALITQSRKAELAKKARYIGDTRYNT